MDQTMRERENSTLMHRYKKEQLLHKSYLQQNSIVVDKNEWNVNSTFYVNSDHQKKLHFHSFDLIKIWIPPAGELKP